MRKCSDISFCTIVILHAMKITSIEYGRQIGLSKVVSCIDLIRFQMKYNHLNESLNESILDVLTNGSNGTCTFCPIYLSQLFENFERTSHLTGQIPRKHGSDLTISPLVRKWKKNRQQGLRKTQHGCVYHSQTRTKTDFTKHYWVCEMMFQRFLIIFIICVVLWK